MFKELFIKIFNKNNSFSKDELKSLEILKKENICEKKDDFYELNSKYKVGTIQIDKNKAILKDLENEHKDIFLDFEHLNSAYDGDFVLVKRVFNPRSKIKGKVLRVLDGKKSNILVYIKNNHFYTVKESIKLNHKISQKDKEGCVCLINSNSYEIIEEIGNINEPKIDEYLSLSLYNELIRKDKVLDLNFSMDDEKQRVDLTTLPFCTIDPNSAKDHDDAIYYDNEEKILYVAIADVSYFVKEGTTLDKLAYKKSTSLYLPQKVLPMLPNTLSEDLCSLKEGVNRYAYVFKIYLDIKNKQVKKSELFEAVIKSHKKYSYGRIDRVLEGHFDQHSSLDKEIFDYLLPLYEVTKEYRAQRLKLGYDFRSSEIKLKLKNDLIHSISEETSTASHQLVEECMLLANIEASKKVNALGIFRIHEEPSFKDISKLVDDVNLLGLKVKLKSDVHSTINHIQKIAEHSPLREEVDELIIQSQTQAKYSSKNLGHFGLGFKSYSHFTSPIRRYSDLVLHRILKSKKTPENIDEICEYISIQERKINELVWDFEDRKYARWAKEHIGEEIRIKITDTKKAKAICYKGMKGMKVILDNYKGQTLFSKTKAVIKEVDLASKLIVCSLKY